MKKEVLIFTIIMFLFTVLHIAHAQVRDTDIVLGTTPNYPSPNENVKATLSSYSTDLNKANISWSINNQETMSGIGKKVFSFNVGSVGSQTTVTARIDTLDGQSLVKTIILTPAGVDMLWEATDSYVPPFYKGKALAPSQGTFKIVVMPNLISPSGRVNSNNLSYAWTKDGNNQQSASGWGKSYFIFKHSYLDINNQVEVTASDITSSTNASGKITLQIKKPKIIFYQNNPALGVNWENALSDGFAINPSGETLVVAPYFFSPKNINSSELVFDWSLNGEKIDTPNPKNILSISPAPGQSGSAKIKVAINNARTLFQSLEKEINVNF